MTKLEQLIEQLCPDGVEYMKIEDFAKCETAKNKNQEINLAYSITKSGLVPTAEYFKDAKVTSDNTSGYRIVKRNWFVYSPSRIDVGSINYLRENLTVIVSPLNVVFSINENIIRPDYLLYFLQSRKGTWQIIRSREGIEGTGRKLLPFDKFAKINVPVPPLEVQAEIVRILDKFTELTAELTTELTNRKKQFEFYKELCFDADTSIERVPTKDITSDRFWLMPATPKYIDEGVPYITSKNINKGHIDFSNVKYISVEDYAEISRNRKIMTNDLLITMIGTIGESALVGEDTNFYGQNIYLIRIDETKCLRRYYYHYISSSSVKNSLVSKKNASSQGYIKAGSIDNLMIPLPSIEEQQRIVNILDRFDSLCNDISEGLPAEIEARQKQYEYYRDTLLNFKEVSKQIAKQTTNEY